MILHSGDIFLFLREDYDEDQYIPQHPCFTLISNCEQVISRVLSRRLLTYEKIKEPSVRTFCARNFCNYLNNGYVLISDVLGRRIENL